MAFIAAMSAAELIAAGTAAASAAAGAYSAISSAQAQRASAESAAKAAQYNQTVNEQKATVASQQAAANADASTRRSDLALGTVLASGAQSGTGLSGSTGALYQQDATSAEMDAMNIRYQGALQSNALQSGAQLDQFQSEVATQNASEANSAGYVGAASAVLSSAGGYFNNKQRLGYYGTRYGGYANLA